MKLRQFVALGKDSESGEKSGDTKAKQRRFRMEALIIRNDICVCVGILSTSLCYILWGFAGNEVILWLDVVINCCVIGAMFKWNEKYFKRACGPCVMLCFKYFNNNDSETEMTAIVQQAEDYLHTDSTGTEIYQSKG